MTSSNSSWSTRFLSKHRMCVNWRRILFGSCWRTTRIKITSASSRAITMSYWTLSPCALAIWSHLLLIVIVKSDRNTCITHSNRTEHWVNTEWGDLLPFEANVQLKRHSDSVFVYCRKREVTGHNPLGRYLVSESPMAHSVSLWPLLPNLAACELQGVRWFIEEIAPCQCGYEANLHDNGTSFFTRKRVKYAGCHFQ